MLTQALRVLIVEDSEPDYELMVHALRRSGFAVTAARVDREPALTEALRSFSPDIVLSDHALPQLSGLEVMRIIQREQQMRSEEHTSELQSQSNLVCRLLLEKKKKKRKHIHDNQKHKNS